MTERTVERVNALFDAFARFTIRNHDTQWSAFRVCGYVGTVAGSVLAVALIAGSPESPLVMACLVLVAILTFLTLAMLTRVVTGQESLTYYHHQIAVLGIAALALWATGHPIAPYLDAMALGIGAFLVNGRIGCLATECCHGRRHRLGVRYSAQHAGIASRPSYVGERLFPVQLVEAVWVAGIVAVGSVAVVEGTPGVGLGSYVVAYGLGRFWFETLRGDRRPHYHGLSQAQWLSVILPATIVIAEAVDLLPLRFWHLLGAIAIALMASRRLHRVHSQPLGHDVDEFVHPSQNGPEAARLTVRTGDSAPA